MRYRRHAMMPIPVHSMLLPDLNKEKSSITPRAPTGGFYSLQKLVLREPLATFNMNLFVSLNRANRTVPQNAMTPDIYRKYL